MLDNNKFNKKCDSIIKAINKLENNLHEEFDIFITICKHLDILEEIQKNSGIHTEISFDEARSNALMDMCDNSDIFADIIGEIYELKELLDGWKEDMENDGEDIDEVDQLLEELERAEEYLEARSIDFEMYDSFIDGFEDSIAGARNIIEEMKINN